MLHILQYVRKICCSKSRQTRKFLHEFFLSFFLLSLVIIPPLSSLTIQKMLRQDPYFAIFAQEDGNSKLLVNLVDLLPVNDVKAKEINQWIEVIQEQQNLNDLNIFMFITDSNLFIIPNSKQICIKNSFGRSSGRGMLDKTFK